MNGCNVNIPYYGDPRYLCEAVDSALRQDPGRYAVEVSVLDDACPYSAARALPRNFRERCRIIRHPSRLGMVANWNECLRHGDLDAVQVLHGDDLLRPSFSLKVMNTFAAHDRVGLVYTGCQPISSRVWSTRYWGFWLRDRSPGTGILEHFPAGDAAVRQALLGVTCSSAVVRRSSVETVGLFRVDYRYSADEEYWARLAAAFDVARIDLPLVRYRYHSKNYQIQTWLNDDFWESFLAVRQGRMKHLILPRSDDQSKETKQLAALAVSIALKLLGAGHAEAASRYLERARELCPDVIQTTWYRRLGRWIAQGSWGRLKAWIRSPH